MHVWSTQTPEPVAEPEASLEMCLKNVRPKVVMRKEVLRVTVVMRVQSVREVVRKSRR